MSSPARAAARRAEREPDRVVGGEVDGYGKTSLYVGFCTPGHVDAQFCKSLTDFQYYDARNFGHLMLRGGIIVNETGPRLATARNQIVREFLKSDGEFLLMIDSDMAFEPEAPYRLLDLMREDDEVGIVGGLCFGGGHSSAMFPTIYAYENNEDARNFILTRFPFYPVDKPIQVHGTGAAFTLMRRTMLEDLASVFPEPYPWYAETVRAGVTEDESRDYGEDIVLCIRAVAKGWKILVDTRVKIDHYKRGKLNEEVYMTRIGLMDAHEEMKTLIVERGDEAGELVQVGD